MLRHKKNVENFNSHGHKKFYNLLQLVKNVNAFTKCLDIPKPLKDLHVKYMKISSIFI